MRQSRLCGANATHIDLIEEVFGSAQKSKQAALPGLPCLPKIMA